MDMTSRMAIQRAQAALSIAGAEPAGRSRDPLGDAIRRGIVHTLSHIEGAPPSDIAAKRHGSDGIMTKASVSASGQADHLGTSDSWDEWFPAAGDPAFPMALPRARRAPIGARVLQPDDTAQGFFVAEGAEAPLSFNSVQGVALFSKRVITLSVVAAEILRDARCEPRTVEDLRRATYAGVNGRFFSAAAESAEAPAGILNGVVPIPSTGVPAVDVGALFDAFGGNFADAAFLCDPQTAGQLALSGSTFQTASVTGQGAVASVPQWSSRDLQRDSDGGWLILLDQSAISLGFEGIEVSRSRDATLNMVDADGGSNRISLFQNELVALKLVAQINWKVARAGAVVAVHGINYADVS